MDYGVYGLSVTLIYFNLGQVPILMGEIFKGSLSSLSLFLEDFSIFMIDCIDIHSAVAVSPHRYLLLSALMQGE
jgi:hypothetical protein